jgi:hypothetical protein
MRPTGYTAAVDGQRVDILRDGVIVATGRWTGRRIEDCPGALRLERPRGSTATRAGPRDGVGYTSEDFEAICADMEEELASWDAICAELEEQLAAEEAAALAEPTHNADGVDLTLIDWVLGMTPRERLQMVEAYAGVPFGRILDVLEGHGVEFIIIGGVAASLQGADYSTKDLDILYSRRSDNLRRLMAALTDLEALFRDFGGRRIAPNASHLEAHGPKLIQTKFGPLDLLGTLSMEDDGTTYEAYLEHAVVLETPALTLRVLSLEKLIEVKQRAGRQKDLLVLPLLRAALERSRGRT